MISPVNLVSLVTPCELSVFNKVVLPAPELPIIASISPGFTTPSALETSVLPFFAWTDRFFHSRDVGIMLESLGDGGFDRYF